MWDWIVNILFELLKLIQTFAVDWGLSIIILVVIVRLLLTPLLWPLPLPLVLIRWRCLMAPGCRSRR